MAETGGLFIRDRPALSHEAVQSWFNTADLEVPSIEAMTPIIYEINHLDLIQAFWNDDPKFRAWRNNAPSRLKQVKLAQAINTICCELPSLIDEAEALKPSGDYEGYKNLVNSAQICLPSFKHLLRKEKGRTSHNWHRVARSLRSLFEDAMRTTTSGTRCLGFGQPTGRGIALLKLAFLHLGLDTSNEQIVDALRLPRARVRRGK